MILCPVVEQAQQLVAVCEKKVPGRARQERESCNSRTSDASVGAALCHLSVQAEPFIGIPKLKVPKGKDENEMLSLAQAPLRVGAFGCLRCHTQAPAPPQHHLRSLMRWLAPPAMG